MTANVRTSPTFYCESRRVSSHIDVTFHSAQPQISEWLVLDTYSNSNHWFLFFEILPFQLRLSVPSVHVAGWSVRWKAFKVMADHIHATEGDYNAPNVPVQAACDPLVVVGDCRDPCYVCGGLESLLEGRYENASAGQGVGDGPIHQHQEVPAGGH